jgi:ABC-type glycerol-3-phosphate transport system substrate-binding protein
MMKSTKMIMLLSLIMFSFSAVQLLAAETGGVERKAVRWSRGSSINEYLDSYKGAVSPQEIILLNASSYDTESPDAAVKKLAGYEGKDDVLQWTDEKGTIGWEFDVQEAGFYHLALEYIPLPCKGMSIEFGVKVDGKYPYDDFMNVRFSRMWQNASEIRKDTLGNELVPEQVEIPEWTTADFLDTQGFFNRSLPVYMEKGHHTLELELKREALVLKSVKIYNAPELKTYSEFKADHALKPQAKKVFVKVQAELAFCKSDSTLIPTYDRSSAATEPQDPAKIRLNTFGGNWVWKLPGQWGEWKIDVPEDGLYCIFVKGRQNYQRGMAAVRKVYVDGVVPCREFENLEFAYSLKWGQFTPRDPETGKPCYIFLTKGSHTVRLESTIGRLTPILTAVDDLTYELNTLRRRFVMIMGTEPDLNRDYQLEKEIPGLTDKLLELSDRFKNEADEFERITGQQGSEAATLRIMVNQLSSFAKEPQYIPNKQTSFRDNIANLAAWILYRKESPLEIDYLGIASPDVKLPKATPMWIVQQYMNVCSFFSSFVEDYDSIGKKEDNAVTVWIQSGRDQAQILRNLITNDFTPRTGIKVNLSLVQGSIVEATMAGRGPEIAINVSRGQPVNLASRGALYDLSTFSDFDSVRKWYNPTSFIPYEFQGGTYALPMTQDFHMMFYRTDIFEELGLQPPQTWDDLYAIIPVLQRNNMQIYLPYQSSDGIDLIDAGMGSRNLFPTLLAQNGGSFYRNNNTETGLTEPQAYKSFKEWVDFYALYGFTLKADFPTRFRSGEMPLGIASYGYYNMLSVAAPEIRNEWAMTVIPGTRKADGSIDRSEAASGSAVIMFKKIQNPQAGWEFIKWWMSPDVQLKYASQLETQMGTAARLNTANLETFRRMGWSRSEQEILNEQWKSVKEVQEVPGGYYTIRMIDTAFSQVYYSNKNARATLTKYCDMINEEINRKRKELGIHD